MNDETLTETAVEFVASIAPAALVQAAHEFCLLVDTEGADHDD
ncbi:hypothetical protein ACJU26_04780 [Acidithiobacillus sp. M4-SHS-6]